MPGMIPRALASSAQKAFAEYPVVTLTGPRQSGKTTLARSLFDLPYVNLEALDDREFATRDPRAFLARYADGAIIDEIQRAPDLTSYLQGHVDETNRSGQFVLTGSYDFAVREQVSQSLAGRTALLTLLPLSQEELGNAGLAGQSHYQDMLAGGYPRIYDKGLNPTEFHRDYVGTYLERDLRQLSAVRDLSQFQTFMRLCAANIGALLNLNRLANDCGISQTTATEWLTLMEASYVLFRLQPYFANTRKRLVKRPKLYFHDTGLACFLLGITAPLHLEHHPLRGAIFENWVISEVMKFDTAHNHFADLAFYADAGGHEIDLLYRPGADLVPIEIKSGQTFHSDYFKGISYFAKHFPSHPGMIVYAGATSQQRSDGQGVVAVRELPQFLHGLQGAPLNSLQAAAQTTGRQR